VRYRKKMKNEEKNEKKEKRFGFCNIVRELNMEVLEFGIAFMLDFDVFPNCCRF